MELLQGDEVLYDSDISVGYSSQVDSEIDIEGIINNFNQPLNNRPWINVDANGYVRPHQIQPFTEPTGMARRLPIDATPLDYFELLITNPQTDQTLISLLVEETNRYANNLLRQQQAHQPNSRISNWTRTNEDEMKAFLGLLLATGIVKKPTLESYWNESNKTWLINTPGFTNVMRRNRFQNILQCLHCNNNENAVPRGQEGYDPIHKIRPVLNLLNETFSHHYRLGRDVTVDESLVGFKGRNHLVQYMPAKKSHRWGPKFFLLAESDTGYVHQLRLYAGKSQNQRNPQGVTFDIVVDLLQPHFNKYHHVTLDNFFCSPSLCHHLYQNGMYCTGTVRVFRKGMPPSFRNIQIAKGEMTVRQQGPLMAVAYNDRRLVKFLSTFATPV
ncbi:hypothetical protein KUTeg_000009 [Tegillarca granosa]|uniref:PiggyBac transposable element-derived protein domain-containing protein n=1 Tax=Tegillarca granosa TaxID=220873 RepID=A0ABQ9G1Q9_TEGGR|nr:hypothetical protein KUTeg_000009 [Tegillarca granosa]